MGKPASEQLDSSDAIFVDVIHTSANSQEAGVLGPIGNREEAIYSFLLKFLIINLYFEVL